MSNQQIAQKDTSSKPEESSKIELRLPDPEGETLQTYAVAERVPVHKQPETFTAFKIMIESTRSQPIGDGEASMLLEAMRRDNILPEELHDAFWAAYKDQYTPATGIEWRHLWKHIELQRKGRDRQLYSFEEMLEICHRKHITTDHFEKVEVEGRALPLWKRKS